MPGQSTAAQVGETKAQEGEGAGRKDCPPTPNPHLWLSLARYSANMRTAWSSGAEDGLISSRTTPYFLYGETSTLSAPPALPWNTESFSGFQHHPNEAPKPRTYTRHPRDSSSCQVPNPHFVGVIASAHLCKVRSVQEDIPFHVSLRTRRLWKQRQVRTHRAMSRQGGVQALAFHFLCPWAAGEQPPLRAHSMVGT